jgi:hypothetical protein
MEPLSAVASVIAVVQLTQAISLALKVYYQGAREARAEVNRPYSTVHSLELVLKQVEDIANNNHGGKLQNLLTDPSWPLEQLKPELEGIQVALKAVKS